MCEIVLEDDLVNLKNTTTVNNFRADSPELDSQSSQSSSELPTSVESESKEKKLRIMDKIRKAMESLEEGEEEEYIFAC